MWQYIIVYIIGLLALIYIGVKTYRFFQSIKEPDTKPSCNCTNCPGCGVKK